MTDDKQTKNKKPSCR